MTDAPPPGGPQMEEPKPARNWRSFGKEYVIVVMGVLTALAAQQGADWLQWQSEVGTARGALQAEIFENNGGFLTRRVAIAPCMERQLNEADAIIADLEAKRPPGKFTVFRPGSTTLIKDSEWQSQRSSQVLTHFPRAEMAMMGSYYALLQRFDPWLEAEGVAWQELSILQNPPAGMTTSDLIRLRVNLGMARRMEGLILGSAKRALNNSRLLGVAEAKPVPIRVKYFCNNLTPAEYQLWQKTVDDAR